MHVSSSEFADDPCSSVKRSSMVRAARALLSAVTRLLILADMVDVYLLLKSLRAVCHYGLMHYVIAFLHESLKWVIKHLFGHSSSVCTPGFYIP